MPILPIKFRPGINTTFTAALNEGGWSASNLIRWVEGLPEKVGGWTKYWPFSVASAIRQLRAWSDFNGVTHLGVGAEATLGVITSGSLKDVTPQAMTTNPAPDIRTTSASRTVEIVDPGISNVTTLDAVEFKVPVSVGGIVLSGGYPIATVTGATSYQITAASPATATVTTVAITGATNANPCVVTAVAHGRANGDIVFIDNVGGMTQINDLQFVVAGVTANTFQLSGINSTAYGVYTSGGSVYGGIVPQLSTTSGSSTVDVRLPDHGLAARSRITFATSTSVGGVTISGTYLVTAVSSVDAFQITASSSASSTATALVNSGAARLHYHIALGPTPAGVGYGLGGYGLGGYGLGASGTAQTGTPITATDWTLDTWGQTFLACPANGPIYAWDPNGGFETAQAITTDDAPLINTGIFVAMPAQILVAYGSSAPVSTSNVGLLQDPLLVRWSDQDDYGDWSIDTTNQVGSVRLSRGSRIVGARQASRQALLWTDVGVWSMQYMNQPLVFAFNEIGVGCGLIAKHAHAVLQDRVIWMGKDSFFMLAGAGVQPVPCPVMDDVFQDLDTTNQGKCWAWTDDGYSEVWFFYPSLRDGTGECSRYVKATIDQQPWLWDVGVMARSTGIDRTVINYPLAATTDGLIYQHESGESADGQPMSAYVESGDVMIAQSTAAMFVDQVRCDMKYRKVGGTDDADMTVTVTGINDITNAEMSSGALPYTSASTPLTPRIRGHRMRFRIASADLTSWWRLGAMRYRGAPDGRQ